MKDIKFIDFNEYFDENCIIDEPEGYKKTKDSDFDPRGIYSEEIFGNYYSDENDITKRGWIVLNHPLINPIFHIMMKKKKILLEEDNENLIDIINTLKNNPDKILEERRTSKNSELIDFIYKNHKILIIDKYPVFSHKLRPRR